MKQNKSSKDDKLLTKFGTFGEVFTPSVLTILGVIMFLRYPSVVGYAGLWGALLILLAAELISVITGLSLASVSTNMRVKGGGAYFFDKQESRSGIRRSNSNIFVPVNNSVLLCQSLLSIYI